MIHVSKKLVFVTLFVLIAFLLINMVAVPRYMQSRKTSTLRTVYAEQERLFTPTVEQLTRLKSQGSMLHCSKKEYTYTRTTLACGSFQRFMYSNTSISASERRKVVAAAQKLDDLLRANGWTADRPQDRITTVAGSVPDMSSSKQQHNGVPFHKNIGAVSCNLQVDFAKKADDTTLGTINVDRFSCQQNASFTAFHVRQFHAVGP